MYGSQNVTRGYIDRQHARTRLFMIALYFGLADKIDPSTWYVGAMIVFLILYWFVREKPERPVVRTNRQRRHSTEG